jgi:hypothetical protein
MVNNIRRGLVGLLGIGVVAFGMGGRGADAGTINIYDRTSASIGISDLTLQNTDGASEGYDTANDSTFASSPYSNALEIYTIVEGHKLSTDARPIDTLGWDFNLGIKGGPVTCNNFLKLEVADSADLNNPIYVYDTLHPETKYFIPADGSMTTINLPDLVSQPAGEYAHWRLDVTPEPSSLALLGAGAAAAGAYAGLRRGRQKFNLRLQK